MKQNETAVSACSSHHMSNSAVHTAIHVSDTLERVGSNVSCGSQAKHPWKMGNGKGPARMSAAVTRQHTLGSRERVWADGNGEPAEGKSVLAAWVKLNAVAQWHSRWECSRMKHEETTGAGGNQNMTGIGIV